MGNLDMQRQYREGTGQHDGVSPADKLRRHLSQPVKANPGTRMKYRGLDHSRPPDDLLSCPDTFH